MFSPNEYQQLASTMDYLEVAEAGHERLSLPIYLELADEQVHTAAEAIGEFLS